MSIFHQAIVERLVTDLPFTFDFARRFRDVPPIDPDTIQSFGAMIMCHDGSFEQVSVARPSLVVSAKTLPGAEALPGREPWPESWALLLDVFGDEPVDLGLLLSWPVAHAKVREMLGCPVSHIALVPTWEMSVQVNEMFAVEPELMPIVVTSFGFEGPFLAPPQRSGRKLHGKSRSKSRSRMRNCN